MGLIFLKRWLFRYGVSLCMQRSPSMERWTQPLSHDALARLGGRRLEAQEVVVHWAIAKLRLLRQGGEAISRRTVGAAADDPTDRRKRFHG